MMNVGDIVDQVADGCHLAIPVDFNAFFSGAALEITRRLMLAGRRDLRLLVMPSNGLQADLLIGSGCVSELECGAMLMPELGTPPRFSEAVRNGTLVVRDSTCPAIFHGLGAAEKGVPFMPMAGVIGADVVTRRTDWRVVADPFEPSCDVLLVPALSPEIALFHVPLADRHGNVWIGRRRELALLAHASRRVFVTAEEIVDDDLMNTPLYEDGTLSGVYIDGVAHCPGGSWPLDAGERAPGDRDWLRRYFEAARTAAGFAAFVHESFLPGMPR